ncbi:RNA 2'-phosphotransferase [Nocardioides sp. SYSU D00065]|uniref:RNA 2'-phosphotransferase n=1 Tax=Nocardioides sp. SYSU D00065 TaxID=2817378 RepID=UPI001B32C915|nr:RNA 2'-phosphotransferase [Nocardioides sp. SYSU D00065]
MRPDDVRASKRLSYVLRHRPDSVGLTLDASGWVGVDDLLAALADAGTPLAREDVERIVATNDKQRFEVDRAAGRIRARQGHSVPVDLALDPAEPPAVLYHGTPARNLTSVLATGLDRRGRHHVHLSGDVDTARRVGRRRGEAVVLEVDAAAMARDGATFWRTGNGVWLTDHVPPEHLSVHG